jgi:hypothetical protein
MYDPRRSNPLVIIIFENIGYPTQSKAQHSKAKQNKTSYVVHLFEWVRFGLDLYPCGA